MWSLLVFLAAWTGVRSGLVLDCLLKDGNVCTQRGCLWCPVDDGASSYCSETCGGNYTTETGVPGAIVGFESTLQYVNSIEVAWTSIPGDAVVVTANLQPLVNKGGTFVNDTDYRSLTFTDLRIGQQTGARDSGAPAPSIQTIDALIPDKTYDITIWASDTTGARGPGATIRVKTKQLNSAVFPDLMGSWTSVCTNATGAPGTRLEFTFTEARYSARWEYFFDDECLTRAAEFNTGGDYFVQKQDPEKENQYGIFEFQPTGDPPGQLSLYNKPAGQQWPAIIRTLLPNPLVTLDSGGQYNVFDTFCASTGKEFIAYTESKTSVQLININDPSCSLYSLATAAQKKGNGFSLESDSALVDYVMSDAEEREAEERGETDCETATSKSLTGKTLGLSNEQVDKDVDLVTGFMVVFLLTTIGLSIALGVTCRKLKSKTGGDDNLLNDYSEM